MFSNVAQAYFFRTELQQILKGFEFEHLSRWPDIYSWWQIKCYSITYKGLETRSKNWWEGSSESNKTVGEQVNSEGSSMSKFEDEVIFTVPFRLVRLLLKLDFYSMYSEAI